MNSKSRCRCPHCHKKLEKDTITLTEKGETAALLTRLSKKPKCLHSDVFVHKYKPMSTAHAVEVLLEKKMISRKKEWVYSINKSGIAALNDLEARINPQTQPKAAFLI